MTTTLSPGAISRYQYVDHDGVWERELRPWVPERIFDAHVHLGPPEAVGPIEGARIGVPLTSYSSLTWAEMKPLYNQVYSGKTLEGLIAFPFPLQEVDYEIANAYITDLMLQEESLTGFILANPLDTKYTIRQFNEAQRKGARFAGVKPYYDLLQRNLQNSVEVLDTSDFVPDDLLEWMNDEGLIMMLHTCSIGVGDPECQRWLERAVTKYPKVKIVLAHMGRYFEPEQFIGFFESGLMDHPALFLETSDAMAPLVYDLVFTRPDWCKRLIFGADFPFGFFSCVDRPDALNQSPVYNTYNVIKAVKTALENSALSEAQREEIKSDIFLNNVRERLLV